MVNFVALEFIIIIIDFELTAKFKKAVRGFYTCLQTKLG